MEVAAAACGWNLDTTVRAYLPLFDTVKPVHLSFFMLKVPLL